MVANAFCLKVFFAAIPWMVGLQREEEAPRRSSWSSQEEDHGQCLEAKLLAAEEKR
jgi:hypothetical protein